MARYINDFGSAQFEYEPTPEETETLLRVMQYFQKVLASKASEKPKYYYLQKDEIIQEGDECDVAASWNAPPKWVPAGHTVGRPAPDPSYPAHRVYRRLI